MKSGVLKSGSPRLRLMMSFPWDFNSLARAAMARVCEVDKLLILFERMWFMGFVWFIRIVPGSFPGHEGA